MLLIRSARVTGAIEYSEAGAGPASSSGEPAITTLASESIPATLANADLQEKPRNFRSNFGAAHHGFFHPKYSTRFLSIQAKITALSVPMPPAVSLAANQPRYAADAALLTRQ
jgi:hypothetical protein